MGRSPAGRSAPAPPLTRAAPACVFREMSCLLRRGSFFAEGTPKQCTFFCGGLVVMTLICVPHPPQLLVGGGSRVLMSLES